MCQCTWVCVSAIVVFFFVLCNNCGLALFSASCVEYLSCDGRCERELCFWKSGVRARMCMKYIHSFVHAICGGPKNVLRG